MPWKQSSHAERMKASRIRTPDNRPSASARGYNHNWSKIRGMQLRREPLCRECKAAGFVVEATMVDHIIPLEQGGTNEFSNLQSLCQTHHNKKTAAERGSNGLRLDNVPGLSDPGDCVHMARDRQDKGLL